MNPRTVSIAAAALLLGVGLGIGTAYLLMKPDPEPSQSQEGRKVLYWHDPMVPGTKFDKPGKSPFMDMELVPVYADSANDAGIEIPSSVAQNIGIRIGKVERRAFVQSLNAVGSVAFDERRIEVVQSRVSGTILKLFVKSPLERVKRGQPLAEVLSPEWLAAQQEYLALLDAKSSAATDIRAAARERLVVLGVPDAAIAALEKERRATATTRIHAPIEGVIAKLDIREGSSFAAGSALMQINSLATVWVNAEIPESQMSVIPTGSRVRVNAPAWPGMSFDGRVVALLPDINAETRTLTARIEVRNQDDKLVPGMYVSMQFASPEGEPQLVVPTEAVIMTGERNTVIVARGGDRFEAVEVQIGGESQGHSVVSAGLEEGQDVVLSGQFLIDSEASLKATVNRLQSTAEEPSHEAPHDDQAHAEHAP